MSPSVPATTPPFPGGIPHPSGLLALCAVRLRRWFGPAGDPESPCKAVLHACALFVIVLSTTECACTHPECPPSVCSLVWCAVHLLWPLPQYVTPSPKCVGCYVQVLAVSQCCLGPWHPNVLCYCFGVCLRRVCLHQYAWSYTLAQGQPVCGWFATGRVCYWAGCLPDPLCGVPVQTCSSD